MEIWTHILHTNTFNFIVLIIIIGFVCKFCKIGTLLSKAQDNTKNDINKSVEAKENSILYLKNIKKDTENLEKEIEEIFKISEDNIEKYSKKSNKEIEDETKAIKENTQKITQLEEKKVFSNLSKNTALAAIEVAKQHIINTLKKNPKYHEDFIKESINELDRLNING